MEATLTLHQAGNQLGVEDTTLSRLIRIGAIPEARKIHRPDGPAWVIPEEHLPAIATRNGWTIDLRDDAGPATVEPEAPDAPTPPRGPGLGLNGTTAGSGSGALVPHRESTPTAITDSEGDGAPAGLEAIDDPSVSMAEVLDSALLDRLLGEQEQRLRAQAEVRESTHALAALNDTHNHVTGELEIEKRERMLAADRHREERMARAVADAKVAELRERVVREMALADAEKDAKAEALTRSIQAERDNANAVAAMGWLARRRYKRLSGADH